MRYEKLLESCGFSDSSIVLPNGCYLPKYAKREEIIRASRKKVHAPRWGDSGAQVALCNISLMGGNVTQYGSHQPVNCLACKRMLRKIWKRVQKEKRKGYNLYEEALQSQAARLLTGKKTKKKRRR